MKKRILNLSHAGHSGDIIYSLPLAKSISKKLNGLVNYFVIINKKSSLSPGMSHPSGNVLMNKKSFEFIKPLLESLNYVNEVLFLSEKDINPDCARLDFYRDNTGLNLSSGHIPLYARKYFGLEFSLEQKWLDVEPINLDQGIVCSFSRRYRNISLSYDFLDQFDNVFFVGLRDEYEHFIKINDLKRCNYYGVENALQMARIIAGARLFLGNQSFAFSLAEAIKVNRALEVCEICPNVLPMGHGAHDYINEHALFEILKKHGFFVKRSKKFYLPSYVLYYDDSINKDSIDFQVDRQLMQLNKLFSGVLQKHVDLSGKENDNDWIPDSVSLYIRKLSELGNADLPLAVKNYLEKMPKSLQDDANAFPSVAFSGKSNDFFGGYFAPVIKPPPNRGHFNYVVPCTSADLPALADLLTSLAQQADVLWNLIVVADLPVPDPMWCNLPMLRWQTVAQCADIEPAVAAILAEPLTGWVVVLAADKSSTWPMHAKPAYAVQHHLPANLPLPSFFTPGKNKIAVVMHIYYPELAAELFDSLANIDEPFDLFVSLVKGASDAMVSLILESYPSARIYVAPNLGRDILPFVYLLESGCLDTYTAVLKVHTKYTPQIPEFGAYVRQQLLESLLGSTARVRGIVQAFRTYRDLGMVGPRARLIDSGNAEFHWHDNAEKLLWLEGRVGVPLDLEHARFVAGTMFWFRPAALAALRGCLNPLDFEAEPLPNDGALPHALERYFGILTRGAGYLVKAVEELPT